MIKRWEERERDKEKECDNENEDKKDEEWENHKEEMVIKNEKERTSSMLDCKYNVLHKAIQLKMEKEIINL